MLSHWKRKSMYIGINAQNIYIGINTQNLKKLGLACPSEQWRKELVSKVIIISLKCKHQITNCGIQNMRGLQGVQTDYKMKRLNKTSIEDLNCSFLKSGIHLIESLGGIQIRNAMCYVVKIVKIVIKLKFRRGGGYGMWSRGLESEWVRGGMMPLIGLAPDTFTSILVVLVLVIVVILFAEEHEKLKSWKAWCP